MATTTSKTPDKSGVYLEADIINSPAFRELNGSEIKVLLRFYQRRKMEKRKDARRGDSWVNVNGEIDFSFIAAEKLGFPRSTFMRCRDKLVDVGFIDITETGAGLWKSLNLYGFSDRWKAYGTPKFKEVKKLKRKRFKENIGFQKRHNPRPLRTVREDRFSAYASS